MNVVPASAWATGEAVNEYLDMDITQLMHVQVTSASKRAQSLSDVPAAIFVISQEDIRRSGVTTIPDALAMAPGIQANRISSSRWSVSSRGFPGFTSNKLLVLIDGRSIYLPGYSGFFCYSQNTMLEDVDRIEVIRGPGASIWGANAVNGITNIIIKSAQETQGTLVRLGAGSNGLFTSAARYGGRIGPTTLGRFYVSCDDYPNNTLAHPDPATGGVNAHDGWRPAQGGFRIDGKPHDRAEWSVQGDVLVNREDILISPYWLAHAPYLTSVEDSATITRSNLLGRWWQNLGGGRALTLQSYIDQSSNEVEKDGFEQHFNAVDVQYEPPLGLRQNLIVGTAYRLTEIDFTSTANLEIPDRNDNLYSAFVQDEINLLPNTLWLTLGSKYEHNAYSGSAAPSCDVALFLNDYDKLYSLAEQPGFPEYELSFILSYFYLELALDRSDDRGSTDMVPYFEEIRPTHQISLRSSIALAKNWQLNLWMRYVDGITARDGNNLPVPPRSISTV